MPGTFLVVWMSDLFSEISELFTFTCPLSNLYNFCKTVFIDLVVIDILIRLV